MLLKLFLIVCANIKALLCDIEDTSFNVRYLCQYSDIETKLLFTTSLNIQESANVSITLTNRTFACIMVIVDNITIHATTGLDFLEANQCSLAVGERLLHIPSCKCPIPVTGNCDKPRVAYVIMAETRNVPPYSVCIVLPTSLHIFLQSICIFIYINTFLSI